MHRTLPARRRTARSLAAVAALALIPALAACGDDGGDAEAEETATVVVDQDGNVIDDGSGDDGDDEAGPPLTQEQLAVVVLTTENLGEGWTGGPIVEDDEDGTAPGCIQELATITDELDPIEVAEQDAEYEYGDAGIPSVSSGSVSFEEEGPVADVFTRLKDVLSTCSTVTGADSNGLEWDLTLTYDDTVVSDATDEQINYSATGTITDTAGSTFEVNLYASVVRIGRNVIDVTTTAFDDQSALHDSVVRIGIDRFTSVIIDSEPSQTTAPQPV